MIYRDGKLVQALTRGNGITGEIITANIETIASIPKNISLQELVEIRGEIFITKEDFIMLNSQQKRDGNKIF